MCKNVFYSIDPAGINRGGEGGEGGDDGHNS